MTSEVKDLGTTIMVGDVVYEKLAWWPWSGIVVKTKKYSDCTKLVVVWWGDSSTYKVYDSALTTQRPRLLSWPRVVFLCLLVSAYLLSRALG